jgi:hypothetical protein
LQKLVTPNERDKSKFVGGEVALPTGEDMSNSSIILEFNKEDEGVIDSLSAALFAKGHLWVASDEATSVERLSTSDNLTFDRHRSFPLSDLVRLPARL